VAFEASDLPSFGCGDPTALAGLAPGETVVDLGSGAGLDAFRAAEAVGPEGRVIGVDMTPAMLARARDAARRLGLQRVSFLEGFIEALPLDDGVADVVISNCVLNLSADVEQVLREAARVLRPGGRLQISDTFRRGPALTAPDSEAWCACVDGAHDPATLVAQARSAGFVDVRIVGDAAAGCGPGTYAATLLGVKPAIAPLDAEADGLARSLLAAAGLPIDGWDAPTTRRWGAVAAGRVAGVVALEAHGDAGLLRSWVVAPDARGAGLGGALLAHALREARAMGLVSVAALTTTVPERLASAGFRETTRDALPAAVQASPELRGACPDGARVFVLEPLA
jgi:predicted O-methyltransferase YrrM/GNAT superfamily N-acetyltransferase